MRDLTRVIEFLCKEVIPSEEVSLVQALRDITYRVVYTPPECQADLWRLTGQTLYNHIGLPEGESWKIRVGDVMADKEQIPNVLSKM